ncbi:hypothetical protein GCM10022215_24350 [Nocardioides fonticola]|uniref:ParB-like N-terminal domain-containing protein n=1 Tax=Nocardioides fonticola TaxID=450363 RepID=A0ABP7XMG9_9ACTN
MTTTTALTRQQKADVLRAAIAQNARPLALPTIAANRRLTIEQVKEIVQAHGWPRIESMRRAAEILERGLDPDRANELAPLAATPNATPNATPTTTDQQLVDVLLDELHPDPDNVRDELGDLTELARSIADQGVLQPVVARRHDGHLVLVMGHRRHAAARLAGLTRIPCIIRADMDPDDVLAAMIMENGQRLGLDPIEEARALARLKRLDNATDADLAARVSKSQPYISARLALLSLTPPQQAAVRAGTLSLTRATKLGREQGGIARPGAAGKASAAHLAWSHPLAEAVSLLCTRNGHSKHHPGRPGGVGCGECWEAVIRSDERDKARR